MHSSHRPQRRDAIPVLRVGAGAHVSVRVMALDASQAPSFTIEGSIAVVVPGAAADALVSAIVRGARRVSRERRWHSAIVFWGMPGATMLRGLNAFSLLNAAVFQLLIVLCCASSQVYWCRVQPHRRHVFQAAQGMANGRT